MLFRSSALAVSVIAPAPITETASAELDMPLEAAAEAAETPVVEEEAPLVLESPLVEDAAPAPADELMLEPQSMLDAEVTSNPVPPVYDDTIDNPEPPRRRWLVGDAEEAPRAAPAAGGTLFERMSNIARGAAKADVAPTEPSDPLDIPRFLNRQNNQ